MHTNVSNSLQDQAARQREVLANVMSQSANDSVIGSPREDLTHRHIPFDWVRVMLEEQESDPTLVIRP